MYRRFFVLLLVVYAGVGCKPIPTAPDENNGILDRTYSNEDWGFSISAPLDSLWSLAATTYFWRTEPNGLSPVEVVLRRSNPGSPARPVLTLLSFGVAQNETLEAAANLFDALYEADFNNYNKFGQRSSGTVGGVPTLEWWFQAREPFGGLHFGNNLYLTVLFQRGDQVYKVLCSGQDGGFPEAEFRAILATFRFN